MYGRFLQKIKDLSKQENFIEASKKINEYVLALPKKDFLVVLSLIGIIPESIEHDSSEEKLFSKSSDAVLSRAFIELGLKSTVLSERADSADVVAASYYHDYDLVADAKAFRLSRTAKNQKDFKVEALSNWRKDNDFAILVSPYFQYPKKASQIYAQAIDKNVCLFSWEFLVFLIQNNIKESKELNLSIIWNFSKHYSNRCLVSESKNAFITKEIEYFLEYLHLAEDVFSAFISKQIENITNRSKTEILFWENEEKEIKNYSRDRAIKELLIEKNISNKIKQIRKYIQGIHQ